MKNENEYIQAHYLDTTIKEIARRLGRSASFVKGRLAKMGLEIPEEIRRARQASTRFKPGELSWNAGRPQTEWMSQEGLSKVKQNLFKKGHTPLNATFDGCITLRTDNRGVKYQFIRTSKGVWEFHHRWLWELAHGKIPKDHVVAFKDGNTMNCVIENLECISKAINAVRNKTKTTPEIAQAIILTNQLNQKIKSNEEHTERSQQSSLRTTRTIK